MKLLFSANTNLFIMFIMFIFLLNIQTSVQQPNNLQNSPNEACYLCEKAGTYVKFTLPDTYQKRLRAKIQYKCNVIKKVRACGYPGQQILGIVE